MDGGSMDDQVMDEQVMDDRVMDDRVMDDRVTFLAGLEEKVTVCRRLRRMADQQRSLVSGDDSASLMKLLSDRRLLTDALTTKTAREGSLQKRWAAIRSELSPDERVQAEGLLVELKDTIGEMMLMDAEDATVLDIRKRGVARELSSLSTGRAAMAAYGGVSGGVAGGQALNRTDED